MCCQRCVHHFVATTFLERVAGVSPLSPAGLVVVRGCCECSFTRIRRSFGFRIFCRKSFASLQPVRLPLNPSQKKKRPERVRSFLLGAGSGSRTRVISLEN